MPNTYTFPQGAVIREMEQERLPILAARYAGNEILPITTENAETVLWEIRDNVQGLTFARDENEGYGIVQDLGTNRYYITPGRFGDRAPMDEPTIERMRPTGQFGGAIDVTAYLARRQNELAYREQMLLEYIRWRLLTLGIVSIPKKDGTVRTVAKYTPTQLTISTPWTSLSAATPYKDLMTYLPSANGFGHDFGAGKLWGNQYSTNQVLFNSNQGDLAGRRLPGLTQTLSVEDVNKVFGGAGLPTFEVYDETYIDTNKTPQRFIPDGYFVWVGYRKGAGTVAGNYVMTRNAANPDAAPGIFANNGIVPGGAPNLPYTERGHNGGPKINYTRQIIVVKAF